ncbi:MAG TPA: family 43 glycosylhydrolase, partial [Catenuloplanes sp.]
PGVTPDPTTAVRADAAETSSTARVANPIIKDRFVADPSAHVFNNRMYIYATDDQTNSGTYWDSKVWRAYSSSDLRSWTNHGSFFGLNRGFSWASQYAWAPTAAYRDGYYYFYAPVDRTKIGVARSTSPTGDFRDVRGTPLIDKARDANTGAEPIDPAVFTDDDGQAYLYFGTRTPKVVKLGADMMSTTEGIQNVTINGGPSYGEAPWLHQRKGIYYLSYSTGWPGQIAYATGTSPMGPFTYRGIILDYTNISTNHQSIVEYQNRWYIVYHKNGRTGGGSFKRSLAMEYLHHNADGTIVPVAQTTTGVDPVDPRGYLTLTARHSGKLVEVPDRSTTDGTPLAQYPRRSGGTPQHWQLRDAGDGYVNLVNRNSGKCVDGGAAGADDETPVVQRTCGGDLNQQWQLREADGGYLQLVARSDGRCLDVSTGSTADGAPLVLRGCGSDASQQWQRAAA